VFVDVREGVDDNGEDCAVYGEGVWVLEEKVREGGSADGAGMRMVEGALETLCAEGVLAGRGDWLEEELVADVAGELVLEGLVVVGEDVGEDDIGGGVCCVWTATDGARLTMSSTL